MTDNTRTIQTVKPVHENLSSDTGLPVCINQESERHDASGKQEIQDFQIPSTPSYQHDDSTSTIEDASTVHVLYQLSPRRRNSYYTQSCRKSWVDSRETHQNAARREYQLLLNNPRQANHLITIKYLRVFSANEIRAKWSTLKALLHSHGIIAFVVIEITTRKRYLSDGMFKNYPINQIHYHLLIVSDLSVRSLRTIFNSSCLDAGLAKEEFMVMYESIPDREAFEHKCRYILKYDKFADQAILFQPGTGINKVCSIGRWFINPDGSRASKDKMWRSIVCGWYPKDNGCIRN